MLLINLTVGIFQIVYLVIIIGVLLIRLMYTSIDIISGMIGLLTILMITVGAGIDGTTDGAIIITGIDLIIIGIIGI
jgi:hypothetical protein|tara:strand:+ start:4326 stop:4556 length:231 start_codon:yes stop_codon:yes gene_type:complete